jgi:hypothetical protein
MTKQRKPARTAEQRATEAIYKKSRARVDNALAEVNRRRGAIRIEIEAVRTTLEQFAEALTDDCTEVPIEFATPTDLTVELSVRVHEFHNAVSGYQHELSKHRYVCEVLGNEAGPHHD